MFPTRRDTWLLASLLVYGCLFLMLALFAYAQTPPITIEKLVPEKMEYGNEYEISLIIKNNLSTPANLEVLNPLAFEAVDLEYKVGVLGLGPYMEWNLSLNPGEQKTISYTVKPARVGGVHVPEAVTWYGGERIASNSAEVVVPCNKNGLCELEIQENSNNCPSDCASGLRDGYCDTAHDKICDPDCLPRLDPDCVEESEKVPPEKESGAYDGAWIIISGVLITAMIILTLVALISEKVKK